MTRLQDTEANEKSAAFGTRYVNQKFPTKKDLIKMDRAVNGAAHGYFMGIRNCEEIHGRRFFAPHGKYTEHALNKRCETVTKYYIKKVWTHATVEDRAVITTAFMEGFRVGFREREGSFRPTKGNAPVQNKEPGPVV